MAARNNFGSGNSNGRSGSGNRDNRDNRGSWGNKKPFLKPEDFDVMHAKNKNLQGIVVNINTKNIQIQVSEYVSMESYPRAEFAILNYEIDKHIRDNFKRQDLKVGTKVRVNGSNKRFYCEQGSLRLENETQEKTDSSRDETGSKPSENTEKKPKKKSSERDGCERLLMNKMSKVIDIGKFDLILTTENPDTNKGTMPLTLKDEEMINCAIPNESMTKMSVKDIKNKVTVGDELKINLRKKNEVWQVEKITLPFKKPAESEDLIKLEQNLDVKQEQQEALRQETSNLLLDLNSNEPLKDDPNISMVNYNRHPLSTVKEETAENEMKPCETLTNEIVDLKVDVMSNGDELTQKNPEEEKDLLTEINEDLTLKNLVDNPEEIQHNSESVQIADKEIIEENSDFVPKNPESGDGDKEIIEENPNIAQNNTESVDAEKEIASNNSDVAQNNSDSAQDGRYSVLISPVSVQNEQKTIQINPVNVQFNPDSVHDCQDSAQTNPELIQTSPDLIQINPESVQNNPDSIQNNPESLQNNPDSVQNNPESLQNNPDSVQNSPDSIQINPESIQNNPESIQNNPEQVYDNAEVSDGAKNGYSECESCYYYTCKFTEEGLSDYTREVVQYVMAQLQEKDIAERLVTNFMDKKMG